MSCRSTGDPHIVTFGGHAFDLMGRDVFHPSETARELARLAPRATLIEEWRDAGPGPLDAAAAAIEAFLDVDPDADDAGD